MQDRLTFLEQRVSVGSRYHHKVSLNPAHQALRGRRWATPRAGCVRSGVLPRVTSSRSGSSRAQPWNGLETMSPAQVRGERDPRSQLRV